MPGYFSDIVEDEGSQSISFYISLHINLFQAWNYNTNRNNMKTPCYMKKNPCYMLDSA